MGKPALSLWSRTREKIVWAVAAKYKAFVIGVEPACVAVLVMLIIPTVVMGLSALKDAAMCVLCNRRSRKDVTRMNVHCAPLQPAVAI